MHYLVRHGFWDDGMFIPNDVPAVMFSHRGEALEYMRRFRRGTTDLYAKDKRGLFLPCSYVL